MPSRRRLQYGIFTVVVLILCRAVAMLPVFRETLQQYLDIGDRIWGFLLSVNSGAGLFTVLFAGVLVDRWGARRVLRMSLVGVAIALGCLASVGANWGLVAMALALYGMALRPLGVAVSSYLVQLFPENRRRVLSLNFAGTSVGGMMFPAIAEGLLHLSRSVPVITFAMIFHGPFALAALVVLGFNFFYRRRASFAHNGKAPRNNWQWRDMLVEARFFPLIALMVLHGTADSVLHLWMARFLGSDSFVAHPLGPGYVISGYAVAYVVSRTTLGLLPENFGRKAFMVIPGVPGGGVMITGILSRNYLLTAGGYVLGAFLWSAEYPAMLSLLADEQSERFGAALSLHQLLGAAGIFLGLNGMGYLVSIIGEASMWKAMLLPACVFPVVGIGAALWLLFFGRHTGTQTADGN